MSLGLRIFLALEVSLCYVPGLLLRLFPFAPYISSKQKKILAVTYPSLILLNMLLLFVGLSDFERATSLVRVDMMVIQFVLLGVNVVVIRRYWKENLFAFGLVATCMYMLLSSASFISKFFFTEDPLSQYLLGTGLYILFMVVWYFQIRSMLKKTVSPFLNEKCKDYWKTVWFIPLFLYIAMSIVLPLDENLESFSVLLSRLFISISLIIFARVFSSHNRIIMEKQTLEEELNRSKIHYAEMQSYVEAARKTRHDLKHILNAVRHFIDTNDKSGLSEFCYTVEETQLCDTNVPYTGCSAVDGVLYHYIKRSEASDIRFSYKGNFAHTGISDMDLCVMIGNALENAFEACMAVKTNRFVTLAVEHNGYLLTIMVQNNFEGKVKVVGDTIFSKKSENRIGFGLQTMRSVCEKHGGMMKTEWDENVFTVLMILSHQ
jgi:hypothetical protein